MKSFERGFSLVEVMIAGAIGVALFLYLNQSLVQIKQMQSRLEKGDDMKEIRKFLSMHLSHYRSWRDTPEQVPTSDNSSSLYYYQTPRSELKILAQPLEIFKESWATHASSDAPLTCPDKFDPCRVAAFSSQGVHLTPSKLEEVKSSQFFLAFIHIETTSSEVSRSFIPTFKVLLKDTTTQSSTRALTKMFYVNPSGSLIGGEGLVAEVNDERVDSVARKDCMVAFGKSFPQKISLGFDLCQNAESKMPAECFANMRHLEDQKTSISMVVCSGAKNHMAFKCFQETEDLEASEMSRAILCSAAQTREPIRCAKKILAEGVDPTDVRIYKTCSRAQDTTPADCFLGLHQENKEMLQYAHFLCPHH